ncbi:hypothetical protein F4801DRAFT_584180 [Xylaria longipes]|nr:hypothetical protein F4801DRAFT_584180 [Xylaria longipes]
MLRAALITFLASLATVTCTPEMWYLIGAFNAGKARSVLTQDFAGTSDSVNAVSAMPPGNVTYNSRDAFMAGQRCWPAVGMDVVAVDAVTCDTVVLQWTQRWVGTTIARISAGSGGGRRMEDSPCLGEVQWAGSVKKF